MAKTPVKNRTMKATAAKKATTTMAITKKGGAALLKGASFVAKRVLPPLAAYEAGRAIKEKRYGDAVGAAAWLTLPTGIMFETTKLGIEQNKGKPIPIGAQIRFGLDPSGKPRGK